MSRYAVSGIFAVALSGLVALGCTPPDGRLDRGPHESFELARGVLVDPETGTVFAMTLLSGVEAFRVRDGIVVWGNRYIAQPLLVSGDIVVAAVEPRADKPRELDIALVKSSRRGRVFQTATVTLPDDVTVSLVDGPASRVSLDAAILDGRAGVAWRFTRGHLDGQPTATIVDVSGAVEIHLETGELARIEPQRVLQAAAGSIPEAVSKALSGYALRAPAWRAGSWFAAVTTEREGDVVALQLHRISADGAGKLRAVELLSGTPAVVRAAADGRHLLVTETIDDPADLALPYRWTIYEVAGGRKVGSLDATEVGAAFCVVDDTLIYEAGYHGWMDGGSWRVETRKLVGRDVATGRLLWERALRDPAYRGSQPPRPPILTPRVPSP